MNDGPLAFFITWMCYGTWLPGDQRGWTKWHAGDQIPQPRLADWCRKQMTETSVKLNDQQRQIVADVIREHCEKRAWTLHAVSCRSNHCHVVVTAPNYVGETVRDQFKSWGKRRLKQRERDAGVPEDKRDYAVPAPVQIRVFEDKLKIWNPAVLPQGWTVETLLGEHSSLPFNPDVANAFFRAGEIEAWGRGIQRVFTACKDAGTPEPNIRYEPNDLWLEFPFSADYLETLRQRDEGKASEKASEKTSEKILSMIRENREVTIAELSEITGVTTRSVERNLRKLQDAGRLERIGPDKGGH